MANILSKNIFVDLVGIFEEARYCIYINIRTKYEFFWGGRGA
jgi:hypothetical protein